MLSVQAALQQVLGKARLLEIQSVPFDQALGRICAESLVSDRPLPPFDRVTMDGFAVRSADLCSPATLQLAGMLAAGEEPIQTVEPGFCIQVMTGAALPNGADAVIQIEDTDPTEGTVHFKRATTAGENIVPVGSEAQAGKVFFEPGQLITPAIIAYLASVGKSTVQVYRRPKLAVISTGTELVDVNDSPLYYQIRDCNSPAILAQARELGIEAISLGIAEDTEQAIGDKIEEGLAQADILILSGGVSMGEWDFVPKVLEEKGIQKTFHKVRLKPGKPIWFGTGSGKWVFGLPGNPVSVQVCFKLFVETLILALTGHPQPEPQPILLPLKQGAKKRTDRETYVPAQLNLEDGQTWVEEVKIGGSGDFSSLGFAQGLFRFDADCFELAPETSV